MGDKSRRISDSTRYLNFSYQNDDNYVFNPKFEGEFTDTRNGLICRNPSLDPLCYYNYIELLNFKAKDWKSVGYLDLGMMPIAMAPSFMQAHYLQIMSTEMAKREVECFQLPAVSLLYNSPGIGVPDLWAFKKDVARALGVAESKVTLGLLLKEVFGDDLNSCKQVSRW